MSLATKGLTLALAIAGSCINAVGHTAISFKGPIPLLADKVDLVLYNGQVKTPQGWASAVAVGNGLIIAVGDDADVFEFSEDATARVDLKGRTVLPGIHDMHVHPLIAGVEEISCKLETGASPAAIKRAVEQCAASTPEGHWITGGNWVGAVFEAEQQSKALLDEAAPKHPVMLYDESYHSMWVNSMALQRAGISADTPNPPGGVIERDATGEPTGVLRETANRLIDRVIPPLTEHQKRAALTWSTNHMLSYGITTFTDAYSTPAHIATLANLSKRGDIKQRIRACMAWVPSDDSRGAAESLIAARAALHGERFKADCVKLMLDGVPTESHTAAMLEPYEGSDTRGILMMPQTTLNEVVTRFDAVGLHLKMHAAGDGAVRAAIDAVEAARDANGFGGSHHEVTHISFAHKDDIPRVRQLGMAWEFSPYIWFPTPISNIDVRRAVGDKRMHRFIPIKDGVESGALTVAASDWSVVPSVNPWLALETLVTRQLPGGSDTSVAPGQAITIEQAWKLLTENPARLMGHRHVTGAIEPGLAADLIVTKKNPFKVAITEVHKTEVEQVFINGEEVFKRQ